MQLERQETGMGRASELSEASPQPVDSATLAGFCPGFLQHPPRTFHFSCIQIFYLFVQFSTNSLMLVKAQPWREKDGQSRGRGLTTPFQALSTGPREEPGGKRENGWTAQLRCPVSKDP